MQRQTACENNPGDTAKQYYRRLLAISFMDHLESRFTSHSSLLAIKCLSIIPSCFTTAGAASNDELLEFLVVIYILNLQLKQGLNCGDLIKHTSPVL